MSTAQVNNEDFTHVHRHSALKYVHVAGWVHRDISHRNILVQHGLARLSDFEYAKEVGVGKDSSLVRTILYLCCNWCVTISDITYRALPNLLREKLRVRPIISFRA